MPLGKKLSFGLGLTADALLVVLLLGISGFIFGGGPEGLKGERAAAALWTAAFLFCLLAPGAGVLAWRRGRVDAGLILTWLPPVAGLVILLVPA